MTSETSQRQKRVDRFIRAANIGTGAMIAYPVIRIAMEVYMMGYKKGDALLLPALTLLAGLVFMICEAFSIFSAFRHRNADEFTRAMWQNGTTFAFFAAILWLFIGGHVENITNSFSIGLAYEEAKAAGIKEVEPVDDTSIVARFSPVVIMSAFFLGLQLKRFRG
jgi:hypothetical protein